MVYSMCDLQNDWTPLPIACHGNYVRIANMLLKNGADVNVTVKKVIISQFITYDKSSSYLHCFRIFLLFWWLLLTLMIMT